MLRLVILIVIGVLALSFFGITIESIVHSPAGQSNFSYLWQLLQDGANWVWGYIGYYVLYVYHFLQGLMNQGFKGTLPTYVPPASSGL